MRKALHFVTGSIEPTVRDSLSGFRLRGYEVTFGFLFAKEGRGNFKEGGLRIKIMRSGRLHPGMDRTWGLAGVRSSSWGWRRRRCPAWEEESASPFLDRPLRRRSAPVPDNFTLVALCSFLAMRESTFRAWRIKLNLIY